MRIPPLPGPAARGRAHRRAAAAVEFACLATAFFTIILGMIEVSRAFMVQHLLTNAARKACRSGVLLGKSSAQISAVAVNTLASEGMAGDTATVLVNDGSTDASAAKSGDEITVVVTIPVSSFSWLPFSKYVLTNLTGQYTLRRE